MVFVPQGKSPCISRTLRISPDERRTEGDQIIVTAEDVFSTLCPESTFSNDGSSSECKVVIVHVVVGANVAIGTETRLSVVAAESIVFFVTDAAGATATGATVAAALCISDHRFKSILSSSLKVTTATK